MMEYFGKAWEYFGKGGVLSWPILLCSLVALAVTLERLWTYHAAVMFEPDWFERLLERTGARDFAGAGAILAETAHPSARVLQAILSRFTARDDLPRGALEKLAGHEGQQEVRRLERWLPALATIGNIAPLLGLMGTVLGMVKAFQQIEAMQGRVNASVLAAGIWEALLTTLFGLAVAIPTVAVHNYFAARVREYADQIQDQAVMFLDALEQLPRNDADQTRPGP